MATIPILFIVPLSGVESGGHCINSTTYCAFGCCGDLDNQFCCFPLGVFIGCGFGILGTICLLITIFRCRLGSHDRATHHQQGPNTSQHTVLHTDSSLGIEYGCVNPAFSIEVRNMASNTEDRPESMKYTPCTHPPSYEECIANDSARRNNSTRDCVSIGADRREYAVWPEGAALGDSTHDVNEMVDQTTRRRNITSDDVNTRHDCSVDTVGSDEASVYDNTDNSNETANDATCVVKTDSS